MRNLLFAAAALALAVPARAERRLGLGLIMGVPFGATAKYWVDDRRAAQTAIGVSDGDLTVSADWLWHFDEVLPRKRKGRLPLYAGLGYKYKAERETFSGVRFVGGLAAFREKGPFELFAEVAPVMRVAPSFGGAFDGAAGVRFYF